MGDERTMDDEVARLIEELDDMAIETEVHFRMLDRQLRMAADGIMADEARHAAEKAALEEATAMPEGSAPRQVDENVPLPIKEILCLPDFGGHLAIDPVFNRPSKTVSRKKIDGFIDKGLPISRQGKIIRIKPKSLREFLSECQDQKSPLTSSGSRPAITKRPGNSFGKASGPSKTGSSSLALDAALSSVMRLRGKG